jgi:hypothetical protein
LIAEKEWVEAPPPKEKYTSTEDQIILEDDSGRAILSGKLRLIQENCCQFTY